MRLFCSVPLQLSKQKIVRIKQTTEIPMKVQNWNWQVLKNNFNNKKLKIKKRINYIDFHMEGEKKVTKRENRKMQYGE